MITNESYTKEWILLQSKTIGKADPNLINFQLSTLVLIIPLIIHLTNL